MSWLINSGLCCVHGYGPGWWCPKCEPNASQDEVDRRNNEDGEDDQ